MVDVDIDPFGEPNRTDTQPDETIPFTLGGVTEGGTWEPEEETSFGGTNLRTKVLREHVEGLFQNALDE